MVNIGGALKSSAMTRSEFGEEDNTESYFENYFANIVSRTVNIRVDSTSIAGSTLVWGNAVFGLWGSFNWGNSLNTSFILGNSLAGVLGSNQLGTRASAPERILEAKIWRDVTEDFTGSTYYDSANSVSVNWSNTGSLTFGVTGSLTDFTLGSVSGQVSASTGSITMVS